MKYVQSIVKHDPPHSYGDCLRACIASILDIENIEGVPHFNASGETDHELLKKWLAACGYAMVVTLYSDEMTAEEIGLSMAQSNPNVYYLLGGSIAGGNHIVVCCNDKIVCDPAWVPDGLDGPNTGSGFWQVVTFTAMRFVAP